MGDKVVEVETKVVSSPEKKVVEEEKKQVELDEDSNSKSPENGVHKDEVKENGSTVETEKEVEEPEAPKNGDAKEESDKSDTCCIKRKSVSASEVSESVTTDGASPEKKAKLEESVGEAESNGAATEAKA